MDKNKTTLSNNDIDGLTAEHSTRVTRNKRRFVIIGTVIILLLSPVVYFSNIFSFTYTAIKCGHLPITASNFAASRSYSRLGDMNYGPSIFSPYYFCTEQQAIDGGFRGVAADSLSAQQQKDKDVKRIEEATFAKNKVPFSAQYPTYLPIGYKLGSPTIEDIRGLQVLQNVQNDEMPSVLLRQGSLLSNYAVCKVYACISVGTLDQGQVVYRSYSQESNTTFWGITLDDSFYNIEARNGVKLTDADVIKMFSSLKPLM